MRVVNITASVIFVLVLLVGAPAVSEALTATIYPCDSSNPTCAPTTTLTGTLQADGSITIDLAPITEASATAQIVAKKTTDLITIEIHGTLVSKQIGDLTISIDSFDFSTTSGFVSSGAFWNGSFSNADPTLAPPEGDAASVVATVNVSETITRIVGPPRSDFPTLPKQCTLPTVPCNFTVTLPNGGFFAESTPVLVQGISCPFFEVGCFPGLHLALKAHFVEVGDALNVPVTLFAVDSKTCDSTCQTVVANAVMRPFATASAVYSTQQPGSLETNVRFTLGSGSQGIHPLTDPFAFTAGSSVTLLFNTAPFNSFRKVTLGTFTFYTVGPAIVNKTGEEVLAWLIPLGTNTFDFLLLAKGADLTGIGPTTTPVSLVFPHDGGNTITAVKPDFD